MSDTAESTWFYTRQGEQHGPLTFAGLQEKARAGEINPRLDMAWTQGMADWKPAGEIEDLFEKRPPSDTPAAVAPSADPYVAPQHDEAAEMLGQDQDWPGARRRSFYVMTILFPILWIVGFVFIAPLLQQQFGAEIMRVASVAAMLVPWIVAIAYGLKRLVNLGMSQWWYLGNLIPILNLWISYRMYVCPAGYAFHKKLDGPGVVLAILFWLIIALSVIMVASIIAMMSGTIGSPEIQQQIEEVMRNLRQGGK